MTIADELIERVCRAKRPARIVLGPVQFVRLLEEMTGMYQTSLGAPHFMGLPVLMSAPREFCASCGAPSEPNVCSYCKTASTTISIEH